MIRAACTQPQLLKREIYFFFEEGLSCASALFSVSFLYSKDLWCVLDLCTSVILLSVVSFLDSLNTNEFERDLPASYDIVFKARPRCYSYSIANSEVQKEEELYSTSDDEAEMANSECVDRSDDFNQATFVTPMSKNTTQIFDVASPVDILPAPAIAPTDAITHVTLVQKSETSVPPSELVTSVSMVHENKPLAVLTFPPDPIQKEQ